MGWGNLNRQSQFELIYVYSHQKDFKKWCTSESAVCGMLREYICGKCNRPMSSKRQEVKSLSEYVEKRELLCTGGGNVTG